jgi:flagellar hook-associated protein 1
MGGMGLILNTAKDALLTQRIAIDVVSHNIANVNTPGYTRQTPVITAKDAAPVNGMIMGRGVDVQEIIRNSNQFIESRLQQRTSDLASFREQEVYMQTLEAIFNESSGQSLGSQLAEFWNAWHDLSNNPSGISERNILFERGSLLSQAFRDLSFSLFQVDTELNLSLEAGVGKVNELISKIADLNPQIVALQVEGNANDLLDRRNNLLTQLSELIDIKTYENENGNLTVTTGKGYTLVSSNDYYSLSYNGNRIQWEASGGVRADITDSIAGGKLGGWLEIRDSILPGYRSDLDQLAGALIWEVNRIHSQGAGLETFSSATSAHKVLDPTVPIGSAASGLPFHDRLVDGQSFTVWVHDGTGAATSADITVDTSLSLSDLATHINGQLPEGVSVTMDNGKLSFTATDAGHRFAFSEDNSGFLSAIGINTFFTGNDATAMKMNSALNENKNLIAAARIGPSGEIASGDNSNAFEMAALQDRSLSLVRHQYARGGDFPTEVSSNGSLENYLFSLVASVGIKSESIIRSREYNEVVVNKLTETRNNLSAVSIDEEMTNLIKFQHAYSAAAKLISTADEMMQTILALR